MPITYPVTVRDKVEWRCPTCRMAKLIYVERDTDRGTERVCCATCSHIHAEKPIELVHGS